MKRAISFLIILLMISVFLLTACTDGTTGIWRIEEISAGEVVMTMEDAKEIGKSLGTINLKEDGTCKVEILENEYDGTWEADENGKITINYGEDQVLNAEITESENSEEKTLTATDSQGTSYKLKR